MRWPDPRSNPQWPSWQPMGARHLVIGQTIGHRVILEAVRIVSRQPTTKCAEPEHAVAGAVDGDDPAQHGYVRGGEVHKARAIETRDALIGSDPKNAVRCEERDQ